MEKEGLKLACLYSYGCQQIKRMGAGKKLLNFFKRENPTEKECDFIIEILKKLQSYRGYCLNGLKIQRSPFDLNVVRAYWLGDSESDNLSHNFATLARFREINSDEHLPDWIANSILDCAVSFGKIIEVGSKKPRVLNYRLLYKTGRVFFRAETREVNTRLVDNLQKGDLVSIHWAIAREKISQKQAKTLHVTIKKAIKTLKIA